MNFVSYKLAISIDCLVGKEVIAKSKCSDVVLISVQQAR